MRIPRHLIWLAFILASIFCWCVFFEYGGEPHTFLHGAREELTRLVTWMARLLAQ